MEKFKKFKIKEQSIIIGGKATRTYISGGQSGANAGIDIYDWDTGKMYDLLGNKLE